MLSTFCVYSHFSFLSAKGNRCVNCWLHLAYTGNCWAAWQHFVMNVSSDHKWIKISWPNSLCFFRFLFTHSNLFKKSSLHRDCSSSPETIWNWNLWTRSSHSDFIEFFIWLHRINHSYVKTMKIKEFGLVDSCRPIIALDRVDIIKKIYQKMRKET